MTVSFLGVAISAFVLSLVLTPIGRRFGVWAGAARPRSDGSSPEKLVPLLGGVTVFVSLAVSVLMSRPATMELQSIVFASGLVLLFGVFEDARNPSAALRWFITAIAAAILVRFGVAPKWLPSTSLGWPAMWALSFLWVLGFSGAFRFLNGLGGLAVGSAAINGFFIGLYALATDQTSLLVGSFALTGAALGFLPYNYKPFRRETEASTLLGGGGAGFLGFTLGSLILLGDWVEMSPREGLVPALIMAVPLFAMAVTAVNGLRDGLSRALVGAAAPSGKARAHPQWPNLGIRKKEAVAIIYLVNLCFGISAFLLRGSSTIDALLVLGQVAVIFGIIVYGMMVMRKRRA
jgi:UDP-GlcNAc:undecaprenyl-phosphate GlcNAc-1-phosphate transferase